MKSLISSGIFILLGMGGLAQFAPPVGQAGTTAMSSDSSAFVAWASACELTRGFQDISDSSLGYASVGDSPIASGIADGTGVVSLGDGGSAVLTFENPITNGTGWDFAVFENSFSDTFLELAFVEVSSDGINFVRFPSTSLTQDTVQIGSFGLLDATKIDNLAGKYRALYGTPFDLEELSAYGELDINTITHVRIIDVVGCIQDEYARYDHNGNKINDPWNTPFASGGFDLDAVGVINQVSSGIRNHDAGIFSVNVFPNPVNNNSILHYSLEEPSNIRIIASDLSGRVMHILSDAYQEKGSHSVKLGDMHPDNGFYLISLISQFGKATIKITVNNAY
jgi:hypothetical protein